MPKSADLNYLLGRVISFTLEGEKRQLLITDAREFREDVIISFHSLPVFGSDGLNGLSIQTDGKIFIHLYSIYIASGFRTSATTIEKFAFS